MNYLTFLIRDKMIEAYPLAWPAGYKRTMPQQRIWSKLKQGMDQAQQFLRAEIARMGGSDLIISTNIPLRRDGGMYTDYMSKNLHDPGVAIYFKYKKKDISMCCDQYLKVWENIYALGKGIEALRGMERWGVSEFLDRAFTGFKALPEQTGAAHVSWSSILEIPEDANADMIRTSYRKLSAKFHPDNIETGNAEKFIQVQPAYKQATSN
jgi:hypothetical protein